MIYIIFIFYYIFMCLIFSQVCKEIFCEKTSLRLVINDGINLIYTVESYLYSKNSSPILFLKSTVIVYRSQDDNWK